jgi:hypothetical protein
VVSVVIAITKFADGAWAVIVFVPVMIWILVRLNRQYEREDEMLDEGLPPFDRGSVGRPAVLVMVEDLDRKTVHALQYAKTIRSSSTSAVHVAHDAGDARRLQPRWEELGTGVPLEVVAPRRRRGHHDRSSRRTIGGRGRRHPRGPGTCSGRQARTREAGTDGSSAHPLAGPEPARPRHPRQGSPHAEGSGLARLFPRASHRVVVLVDRPDRAAMQAVSYALSLGATEVVAVHAAVDPEMQDELIERWMDLRVPVALDLVECWDRDVARSVERYVVDLMGPRTEITVVVPRRDYVRLSQRLLHDRTSRSIAKVLSRYEHVDMAVVPYFLGRPTAAARPSPEEASVGSAR